MKPMVLRSRRSLLEFLGSRLPRYMLPAALIRTSKLPLTASGKVDWRAVPRPDAARAEIYLAPRNATEAQLAAMWSRLLNVQRIGVRDDFFALGGTLPHGNEDRFANSQRV